MSADLGRIFATGDIIFLTSLYFSSFSVHLLMPRTLDQPKLLKDCFPWNYDHRKSLETITLFHAFMTWFSI